MERKKLIIFVLLCFLVLGGILISYAFFIGTGNNNQSESASIQTGNMVLVFEDGNNGINKALNFDESITKTFTIENTGSLDATAKINWKNLTNTYLEESLTYTLSYSEKENGTYTDIIANKQVPRSETPVTKTLANNLSIPVEKTYYYKLVITLNYLETIEQTEDLNAMLKTEFSIEEATEEPNLGIIPEMTKAIITGKKIPENIVQNENPNFDLIATEDETSSGLYAMADDYGTSYYFRGAVENNYVKFAGFYWRIIRINGDGSLRIIYDGTSAHINGEANEDRIAFKSMFNQNTNDVKYVGYMYGPPGTEASTSKEQAQTNTEDSNIKIELETWYRTKIANKNYDKYISDNIFCNDRSIPGAAETGWTRDTGLGYGSNETAYGITGKILNLNTWQPKSGVTPNFKCKNKNDAFTKNDTEKGNGKLNEKIGLITIDDFLAAGGHISISNTNFYLYKGISYYSISPYIFFSYNALVYDICAKGNLCNGNLNIEDGIAPVINLTSEYVQQMIGDGTIDNEYRVE